MTAERKETRDARDDPQSSAAQARLIVFEGIDGSGKGTQAARLVERLRQSRLDVALISFPRYEETFFGGLVGSFLNGKFGSLNEVDPLLVSLLFAGDRLESRPLLSEALSTCDVVVLDRYVASNVAHQGAKRAGAERDSLCRAIEHVEYDLFRMPRPDRVILLDVDVDRAQKLVAQKAARNYTTRTADIQEADAAYLARVRELYLELVDRETNWSVVRCDAPHGLRSIEEIADEIWQLVGPAERRRPSSRNA